MATSKKTSDHLGPVTVHRGDHGEKIGESRTTSDVFGQYTQHYDEHGQKIGTSRGTSDILGSFTQHYGNRGQKTGESRDTTDQFVALIKHYDERRRESGESRQTSNILGPYTQHHGNITYAPKTESGQGRTSIGLSRFGLGSASGSRAFAIFVWVALFSIMVLIKKAYDLAMKDIEWFARPEANAIGLILCLFAVLLICICVFVLANIRIIIRNIWRSTTEKTDSIGALSIGKVLYGLFQFALKAMAVMGLVMAVYTALCGK